MFILRILGFERFIPNTLFTLLISSLLFLFKIDSEYLISILKFSNLLDLIKIIIEILKFKKNHNLNKNDSKIEMIKNGDHYHLKIPSDKLNGDEIKDIIKDFY